MLKKSAEFDDEINNKIEYFNIVKIKQNLYVVLPSYPRNIQ